MRFVPVSFLLLELEIEGEDEDDEKSRTPRLAVAVSCIAVGVIQRRDCNATIVRLVDQFLNKHRYLQMRSANLIRSLNSRLVIAFLALCPVLGCQNTAPSPSSGSESTQSNIPPTSASPDAANPSAGPANSTQSETPPASTTATSEPPPEQTIKAKLEKGMWGPPEQGGTVHTYDYKSLKIADGRKGNYLTDGVPANKDTTVYPVKVHVQITRKFTDGSTKQEEKDQTYVFFKDEFGDWTYRFIKNN